MSDQLTLGFDAKSECGAVRHSDPDTSHEAAASVDANALEQKVLEAIREHGPMTAWETACALKMALNTISPRFGPLQRKRLVRDSGETRPGPSNRKAIVWELICE